MGYAYKILVSLPQQGNRQVRPSELQADIVLHPSVVHRYHGWRQARARAEVGRKRDHVCQGTEGRKAGHGEILFLLFAKLVAKRALSHSLPSVWRKLC